MSLTSYRAAPPRDGSLMGFQGCFLISYERLSLFRLGGDLLSHVLRRSTIGATALNGRVRDGIGCFARAMTTKPKKRQAAVQGTLRSPGLDPGPRRGSSIATNISVVPSPGYYVAYVLLTCLAYCRTDPSRFWLCTLLFLDQIKPIEQLVPVS